MRITCGSGRKVLLFCEAVAELWRLFYFVIKEVGYKQL
jgi:hypothetical protein